MPKAKEAQPRSALVDLLNDIPPRESDETLQKLTQRQEALRTRLLVTHERIGKLERDMAEAQRASTTERVAEALLENPDALPENLHVLQGELTALRQTAEGLRRALERGEQDILHRESERDAAGCRTVASVHRKNVRSTVNAMLHLHHAIVEQNNLRLGLNRCGIHRTSQLRPVSHENFEVGLTDPNSWLSSQLRELVEFGFMAEEERVALQQRSITELDLEGA